MLLAGLWNNISILVVIREVLLLLAIRSKWHRYVKDAIVNSSIEKDVLLTKIIYKPALIKQLFELECSYSGEELSLNKMIG